MRRVRRQERIITIFFLLSSFFFFLIFRLGFLQLVQGGRLAQEAVKQRAQVLLLHYKRGDIKDRHGLSLLGGREETVLAVFPALLEKEEHTEGYDLLSALLHQAGFFSYPYIALRDLDADEEDFFKKLGFEGLVITSVKSRYGPSALATHTVGHTGPGGAEGKVGLELAFNQELKGKSPTYLAAIVNGKKNLIPGLGYRLWGDDSSLGPYDVITTIDSRIQEHVEKVMDKRILRGAVVVMDPYRGDLLAMASRPNFLQYQLPAYLSNEEDHASFLESHPFLNRSILPFSPGSVFKIVIAAAALETGVASLTRKFYCPGYIEVGGRLFRCHQGRAHGYLHLAEAFAYSCNFVFIKLAQELGRDAVYDHALALDLGKKTGIPLGSEREGGEAPGLIPTPAEIPYLGDFALLAIGQGKVEVTPLQVAKLTSVIANGGYLVEPLLIKSINTPEGLEIKKFYPLPPKRVLRSNTAAKLRYMMLGVVEYGTGSSIKSEGIVLGGKTGTAETGRKENGVPLVYSWFTGYLSLPNSQVVITVFIEKPRHGNAAGAFKDIAEGIYPYLSQMSKKAGN